MNIKALLKRSEKINIFEVEIKMISISKTIIEKKKIYMKSFY